MFQNPQGIQSLLKDGGRHFAGMDEALLKNIDAAKQIGTMTRSSFGPFGLNKLIINHLDKHFVTRDAAVILEEMDVVHPAAKLVVMAAKAQDQECGDGTNFVTMVAGELLNGGEELLKQGIHASDVIRGYEIASELAVEKLKTLSIHQVTNPRSKEQLEAVIRTVIAPKQFGREKFIAAMVADACVSVMPEKVSEFLPENVRVVQLGGSGNFFSSHVVSGVVLGYDAMGNEKKKLKAKVAVYGVPLEMTGPETSGTVLLNSATELLNFTKGEEAKMEDFVKGLVTAGVDVVVSSGSVQDIALHYLNKYRIMVLRSRSKYEIRRLCETLGAAQIARFGPPLPEEVGYAESVEVTEISSQKVTVVKAKDTKVSTILLRGATSNMLAEAERSIVDGVQLVRCICCKGETSFCPGAGAAEIAVATSIRKAGETYAGLEQYGIVKFAECLEIVPKILAKNSGLDANESLVALCAAHAKGHSNACVNVEAEGRALDAVGDAKAMGIFDNLGSKTWALRLAVDSVLTILRIQHIIVAKQAGMPKPKGESQADDD